MGLVLEVEKELLEEIKTEQKRVLKNLIKRRIELSETVSKYIRDIEKVEDMNARTFKNSDYYKGGR